MEKERLERKSIKNIKFNKGWIFLEFDGEKLKNKIIVEKHQKFVGRWDMIINAVYVDDDLEGLDMEAVAVHETIEKYVSQKYNLDTYGDAHVIATTKEREFIEKKKGNWKSHQIKISNIWKKESSKSH